MKAHELQKKYLGLVLSLHEPVGNGSGHVLFLERSDGAHVSGYDTFGKSVQYPIDKVTLEKVVHHDHNFDKRGHLLVRKKDEPDEKWKDMGPWLKFDPAYILPSKRPKGIREATKSGINMEEMGLD